MRAPCSRRSRNRDYRDCSAVFFLLLKSCSRLTGLQRWSAPAFAVHGTAQACRALVVAATHTGKYGEELVCHCSHALFHCLLCPGQVWQQVHARKQNRPFIHGMLLCCCSCHNGDAAALLLCDNRDAAGFFLFVC